MIAVLRAASARRLLALDAAACLGMGALLAALPRSVAALTGLPAGLLFWAGVSLAPAAGVMALAAARPNPPRWLLRLVAAGNLGWVAASLALPSLGLVAPNAAGWALLLGQAVVAPVFARAEAAAAARAPLPA